MADFTLAPVKGGKVDPSTHPLFWSPARLETQLAPEAFRKRLHAIDPDLEAAWDRTTERWNVWCKKPSLRHPVARGWQLLFTVKHADGSYVPLDERTFAKLAEISARFVGSAIQYHKRIENEMERDRARVERAREESIADGGGEYFDYLQPKVSMYGASNGSKCANQD
jgi:hypothetical protein